MALTYIGISGLSTGGGTLNYPAGTLSGDLLVWSAWGGSTNYPAGFTGIGSDSGVNNRHVCAVKIAGSETSVTTVATFGSLAIATYRGPTSLPITYTGNMAETSPGTSLTSPALTFNGTTICTAHTGTTFSGWGGGITADGSFGVSTFIAFAHKTSAGSQSYSAAQVGSGNYWAEVIGVQISGGGLRMLV